MSIKYSTAVKIDRLDGIEAKIGTAPHLKIFSGSAPANCDTADSGTLLADVTLPSDWLAGASASGQVVTKSKSGTWEDTSADGTGTAGYFRIYGTLSGSNVCNMQGTVTATGGGGDMTLDNTSLVTGQDFLVTAFTLTAGN